MQKGDERILTRVMARQFLTDAEIDQVSGGFTTGPTRYPTRPSMCYVGNHGSGVQEYEEDDCSMDA